MKNNQNKFKQEKALVRFISHQALNPDRQCRSGGCGLEILVQFWVRYAWFSKSNAECVRSYHRCEKYRVKHELPVSYPYTIHVGIYLVLPRKETNAINMY